METTKAIAKQIIPKPNRTAPNATAIPPARLLSLICWGEAFLLRRFVEVTRKIPIVKKTTLAIHQPSDFLRFSLKVAINLALYFWKFKTTGSL